MSYDKVNDLVYRSLNSLEYNSRFTDALFLELDTYVADIKYVDEYKQRVVNLFLINARDTLSAFITLVGEENYIPSFVLARNIVELLIRISYIIENDKFENYTKERSNDLAKMLHVKIEQENIERVVASDIWEKRHDIIRDAKEFHEGCRSGKYDYKKSLKEMANDSSLGYLYNTQYASLSKFTHCNMSTENFHVVSQNKEKLYSGDNKQQIFGVRMLVDILRNVNICVYRLMEKGFLAIDRKSKTFDALKTDYPILISLDMTTGLKRTVKDITIDFMNNLLNSNQTEDDFDINKESHKEYILDMENEDWKQVERRVKKIESLISQKK